MKKLLFTLALLVPTLIFSQDCENFKTGTFTVNGPDGKPIPNYTIKRKKKVQMEYFEEGYSKSKVVWTSECSYQLIHVKSDALNLPAGTVTSVTILETDGNSYTAIGQSTAVQGGKRFSMNKIEN